MNLSLHWAPLESVENFVCWAIVVVFVGALYAIVSDISKSRHPDKKADERFGSNDND